ncbi:NYN domain-containing protein [Kaistia geumhonensis]|uniref:Uncharacterized LabA/DUF88 family protein n=1 Tax=Kaistia geumhonensis TaxID=410839 RepID=A0ABU0M2A0_9HYPH|nr:NYN domain-containing protein [Kaistia geumhonensis]MCX5479705.1 NYN domain-containing protein [Kaistia geumhonensis]MDQ0515071.1 uncharacterized LabA/DUF88 family protein [Kaistia geumhonensis]
MDRVAIFVDAGYLFAQGSVALSGSRVRRERLALEPVAAVHALKSIAAEQASDCRILRIYWYDGALGGPRATAEQSHIANLDDVKLRLGMVNGVGEQKGVDSLIVTDLIELARLKSISDAVLLSGDEDVRVGVQIAQNYGVRLHLLGIEPARGSQSANLLQEADTTREWSRDTIASFLSIKPETPIPAAPVFEGNLDPLVGDGAARAEERIAGLVRGFVSALSTSELQGIIVYWETSRGVPMELDRRLLPTCRDGLGRELDREEIRHMRAEFQQAVRAMIAVAGGG